MIGHFTQLVWSGSLRFGIGIATGPSRKYAQYGNVETFVVAKYAPRGNFYYYGKKIETYTTNVKPLIRGGWLRYFTVLFFKYFFSASK